MKIRTQLGVKEIHVGAAVVKFNDEGVATAVPWDVAQTLLGIPGYVEYLDEVAPVEPEVAPKEVAKKKAPAKKTSRKKK